MASPFDAWLRMLAASGRRIPDGKIQIDRGLPFYWAFIVGGDWTGAEIACSGSLAPDTGSTLIDFACTTLAYDPDYDWEDPDIANGGTAFVISATAADTADPAKMPSDDDGDGVAEMALDFVLTASGGDPYRVMGGVAEVLGQVTDV